MTQRSYKGSSGPCKMPAHNSTGWTDEDAAGSWEQVSYGTRKMRTCDVRIELVWVKGHANSEGNVLADQAAAEIVVEQTENALSPVPFLSVVKTELDVPQIWCDLGQDWIEKWFWRANHEHVVADRKQTTRIRRQK
ncbi:uncharacterized protein M421DRAFT_96085 [Didymella exigua CBS 183.55]|uniref:Uncharacterized protein n=1 Tax=Didymella exigua CBS 183.55 TaxID=1150837 RepID=A0A6A5R605_9PLEO|nr:uncharacterized protein M421DRAFT_96085 [Didymella exigua CBS 183.55]KAF1923545.1 hypothetical protein M421DRAFT_96085 [Didymella exigua CBS 183.55]